jgi:hypothetical protein
MFGCSKVWLKMQGQILITLAKNATMAATTTGIHHPVLYWKRLPAIARLPAMHEHDDQVPRKHGYVQRAWPGNTWYVLSRHIQT